MKLIYLYELEGAAEWQQLHVHNIAQAYSFVAWYEQTLLDKGERLKFTIRTY